MATSLFYFLRQSETKALLIVLFSILILPLSAFSMLFVPRSIWLLFRSSYVFIVFYILGIFFFARWFARGRQFNALATTNLNGKTYLITGSASGIGKQMALEFAKRGAKVVLFARANNLQKTIDDVKNVAAEAKLVSGYPIDLADLLSIKVGVEQYKKYEGEDAPITALINNAGVMACAYSHTRDGFEMQMGINHFGHFYLTQLLLSQLLKSKSRVINVSSVAHAIWQVACTPDTYVQQLSRQMYRPWRAYTLSKVANIYFTVELQRRFSDQGLQAYVLHPGIVDTDIGRHSTIFRWFIAPLRLLVLKTPLEDVQTCLFCAVSHEAVPGKYHADCRENELGNPYANNPQLAREWWDYSEKIVAQKIKECYH